MGRPASATASDGTTTRAIRKDPSSGMVRIFLGLLLLMFALLIITLQTQTNEAYVNGTSQKEEKLEAQWSIWLQIPRLMFGNNVSASDISMDALPGIIIGQGVELVYIAIVSGIGIAKHASQKTGRILGIAIIIGLIAISIFDFYTDLVYGNVSPTTHFIFAIFCTFVIGFFPTWAISLIESGWKQI